jgi:hypothetical protein
MTNEYPSIAYGYSECGHCHFVSSQPGLDNTSTPCPNCHQPGIRILFPDFTPGALFDAAALFRDAAEREIEERIHSMAVTVSNEVGKVYDPAMLLAVAEKTRAFYDTASAPDEQGDSWGRTLQMAAQGLELPEEETVRALAIILGTSFTTKEQTAMVVLTCAFLESMLSHLLRYVAVMRGMTYDDAEDAVGRIRSFINPDRPSDRRTYDGFFYSKTTLHLEQALEQIEHHTFWDDWEQARTDRNDIMHGKLPFAPADTRERIGRLLDRAFPVFAELQNRYVVTASNP